MSSSRPPYQPPLLHTLFAHIRFSRYLQHFRHVGTSYEASKFTCEFADSSFRFWTYILGGGVGERGDDDDIVMQTPRTTSPEEPFYSVFPVLSRCRTISHSHQSYSGLCELDIGLCEGFRRKISKLVGGRLVFCAVFKVLWSCRSPLLTTVL